MAEAGLCGPYEFESEGQRHRAQRAPAHRDSHTKMGTSWALPNTWERTSTPCGRGRKPRTHGPTPAWRAEVPQDWGLGDTCARPAHAAQMGTKVQEGQRLAQGCHGPWRRGWNAPGDSFESKESTVGTKGWGKEQQGS